MKKKTWKATNFKRICDEEASKYKSRVYALFMLIIHMGCSENGRVAENGTVANVISGFIVILSYTYE